MIAAFRASPAAARWLAAIVAILLAGSAAVAQELPNVFRSDSERDRLNQNVVGIVTGSPSGKYMPLGADLARLFDDRRNQTLRIVVSVGYGSVQNIDDLLNLRGVDFAIVQGDVLDAFRRDKAVADRLRQQMRFVTRLHREEIHILARGGAQNVAALDGKRVSIGASGSGTQITARNLFERLGVRPKFVETGPEEAREDLLAGRIDAMVFVVGRGASVFLGLTAKAAYDAKLAFVPFADGEGDFEPYEPSVLASTDYPALIQQGSSVPVRAVPSVLAVFAWDPKKPRYKPVRNFVETFFTRIGDLARRPGTQRELWCQVDLKAPVGGWERFSAADEWLKRNPAAATRACDERADVDRQCFERFMRETEKSGLRIDDPSSPAAADLYGRWREKNPACPAALAR